MKDKLWPYLCWGIKSNHQSVYTGDSTARMHDTVIRFTARGAYLLLVPQERAFIVFAPGSQHLI